ncbi:hypothetical protein BH09ACT8_BH09ACT8_06070 [soil metagenome]
MSTTATEVARLRGVTAGLFTGALAMAAHGFADAMVPSGGTVALLSVVSVAFGAGVARCQRTTQTWVLMGVLAIGQLIGHLTLSAGGAMPGDHTSPLMLTAHLAAVLTGAVLVTSCERFYTALSSAIRRYRSATSPLASAGTQPMWSRIEPPTQRVRLMAASISHRGPPLGALR